MLLPFMGVVFSHGKSSNTMHIIYAMIMLITFFLSFEFSFVMLVKHKIVSKLTASNDKMSVTVVKYVLFI